MKELRQDILEQPATLLEHRDRLIEAQAQLFGILANCRELVLTGMATSLYAWHSAHLLILAAGKVLPITIETSKLLYTGANWLAKYPLFVLSRSGETAEIQRLVSICSPQQDLIAITENAGSRLGRRAQQVLEFQARENAFPNTKSFLLSLCYALVTASAAGGEPATSVDHWFDEAVTAARNVVDRSDTDFEPIAAEILRAQTVLIVARGHLLGAAQQLALDLQAFGRISAFAISGGSLRHGPIELTARKDILVLYLVADDVATAQSLRAIHELLETGTRVAVIATGRIDLPSTIPAIVLPQVSLPVVPMVQAIAAQRINLSVGIQSGLDDLKPARINKVTNIE